MNCTDRWVRGKQELIFVIGYERRQDIDVSEYSFRRMCSVDRHLHTAITFVAIKLLFCGKYPTKSKVTHVLSAPSRGIRSNETGGTRDVLSSKKKMCREKELLLSCVIFLRDHRKRRQHDQAHS